MTTTVTMLAPAAYMQFRPRSGVTYIADASGIITGVTIGDDVLDLLKGGCLLETNALNIGTPGTGVTAVEFGDAYKHVTILTLGAGCVLPAIAGGAALGVGALIYTLPAGRQIVKESVNNVAITHTQGHINADTPTVGLGTVIATGAVSVLSGTATFQNINVGKAAADCNGTPTVQTAKCTSSPFELVRETGDAKTIHFNAAATWAASGDAAAKLSGTVGLIWDSLP